jgi:hypothetical protein
MCPSVRRSREQAVDCRLKRSRRQVQLQPAGKDDQTISASTMPIGMEIHSGLAQTVARDGEQHAGGDGEAAVRSSTICATRPPMIHRTGGDLLRLALGEVAAQGLDRRPYAEQGETAATT